MMRALRADAGPAIFVWSVWLGLSLLLTYFVLTYSVDIPFLDDWEMIPGLTGVQPVTLDWLWAQHNEHRIFIPRIIYLAIVKLGSYDFRAGAVFDLLLLSATAAALIAAARTIRGRVLYSDAFFPLVLLHWGQTENLIWGFTMPLVLGSVLAACLLCVLMKPGHLSFRAALPLALCTIALPLISGSALALVPAFAACTVLTGWELRKAQPALRRAWISIIAAGFLGIGLFLLYFVGYQRPPAHPVSPSLGATLQGTLQFMSLGFGSGSKAFWPASGLFVAALTLATVLALLWALRSGEERPRSIRALLFLAGMGCLAGGIAWARIALYPQGLFSSRYATLAAPLLCCIYFAWEVVKRPQIVRFVQMVLFFVSALLLVRNAEDGRYLAATFLQYRQAAVADVQNGMPLSEVANRHCGTIYICGTDILARRMQMLRDHQIGPFALASE
jgi:hypothetical protein